MELGCSPPPGLTARPCHLRAAPAPAQALYRFTVSPLPGAADRSALLPGRARASIGLRSSLPGRCGKRVREMRPPVEHLHARLLRLQRGCSGRRHRGGHIAKRDRAAIVRGHRGGQPLRVAMTLRSAGPAKSRTRQNAASCCCRWRAGRQFPADTAGQRVSEMVGSSRHWPRPRPRWQIDARRTREQVGAALAAARRNPAATAPSSSRQGRALPVSGDTGPRPDVSHCSHARLECGIPLQARALRTRLHAYTSSCAARRTRGSVAISRLGVQRGIVAMASASKEVGSAAG